jgi:hypothetical protein
MESRKRFTVEAARAEPQLDSLLLAVAAEFERVDVAGCIGALEELAKRISQETAGTERIELLQRESRGPSRESDTGGPTGSSPKTRCFPTCSSAVAATRCFSPRSARRRAGWPASTHGQSERAVGTWCRSGRHSRRTPGLGQLDVRPRSCVRGSGRALPSARASWTH